MPDTLRLDLTELEALYRDLLHVSIAFSDIDAVDKHLSEAVGHDPLGGRVHEFGAGWDDRRKKIIASLDTIWRAVQAVQTTFVEVDGKLADALEPQDGA